MVQRYPGLQNIFSSHLDAERLAFRGLARGTDATVGTEEGGRGRGGEGGRGGEVVAVRYRISGWRAGMAVVVMG